MDKQIDKEEAPFYYKIYKSLREEIENGAYKTGDLLPSEVELGERFGVSRTTI